MAVKNMHVYVYVAFFRIDVEMHSHQTSIHVCQLAEGNLLPSSCLLYMYNDYLIIDNATVMIPERVQGALDNSSSMYIYINIT